MYIIYHSVHIHVLYVYIYIYISKINVVVPDISPAENPQEKLKSHGKTNKTMTNKDKNEEKPDDLPYRAGQNLSVLNSGSQNTEQVDHKTTLTNKSAVHNYVDHAGEKGNSTQSGSVNDVKNNVKEKAHTLDSNVQNDSKKKAQVTINTAYNDATKLAHTADSNTHSTNKQAHSTNNSVMDIIKKQEHFINSSNQAAEVTPHNAPVSSINTERIPEADKYDDSTGKSSSSDSKSNIAPQPENKSPSGGYASDPFVGNQNDNEESVKLTDEKVDKIQGAGVAGNFYIYFLIKNVFILAVFFVYTHTHRISNVECWLSALYTLYRSCVTVVGIVTKLQAGL